MVFAVDIVGQTEGAFFAALGDLINTGSTRANTNDIPVKPDRESGDSA